MSIFARLGHLVDGEIEEGIGPAYSEQFFLDEMSVRAASASHSFWMGQTRSSPCTHVVVLRHQRQADRRRVPSSAGACVELRLFEERESWDWGG